MKESHYSFLKLLLEGEFGPSNSWVQFPIIIHISVTLLHIIFALIFFSFIILFFYSLFDVFFLLFSTGFRIMPRA